MQSIESNDTKQMLPYYLWRLAMGTSTKKTVRSFCLIFVLPCSRMIQTMILCSMCASVAGYAHDAQHLG
jgi:hypothetical protein